MTQVNAKASGKPLQSNSGDTANTMLTSVPRARGLVALMVAAAAVSLAVATRAPLATTVLGLIVFGVLHNVLEIRYVAGRFATILTGRFLALLLLLTTGIALCRLTSVWWPLVAKYAEIGIGYLILVAGCRFGLAGWRFLLAVATLAVAGWASFSYPGYHFVVLTHLHNLVPLIFLWEWAGRIRTTGGRAAFRLAQVLWIVLLPLLILLGAMDPVLVVSPGVVERFVGNGRAVILASAPPDAAQLIGVRFLVVFAFMQTMHYVVWVGFLPKFAPDAAAAFEARVPWLRGSRAWLVGLGGGAFLAVLFFSDYFQGKALYSALATYHAYLEFPVLLALVMAGGNVAQPRLRPGGVLDPPASDPGATVGFGYGEPDPYLHPDRR
jgi:hypothetical protein